MKRYLKLFVLLLLSVIVLASCSNRNINPTTTTDNPNPTTSQVVTEYNIRFLQDDNSTVIKEMKVNAGEEIKYTGDTPTKASDKDATIELSSFEASGDAIFIAKDYNGIFML